MKAGGRYVELHCHSNFSLLDGASHPEDLVARAADLGMPALALTDHDGLYGAIRFYKACHKAGIKPVIGAEITLENGNHLTLLAKDNQGYSNLCRLITRSRLQQEHRGQCTGGLAPRPSGRSTQVGKDSPAINLKTLARHSAGLICLSGCRQGELASLFISGRREQAQEAAKRYSGIFGPANFYVELQNNLYPDDGGLCRALVELAGSLKLGYVATNNVHYARKESHKLHDVLTCIRDRTTLDECTSLKLNSEFHLKSCEEMAPLFQDYPEALSNTLAVAEQCNVDLDFSGYRFPEFPLPHNETAGGYLAQLCRQKIPERYGPDLIGASPEACHEQGRDIEGRVKQELELIEKLGLSAYFLIVWDIMDYARRNGIPAQGRGSAANSIVAYILGITGVDPIKNKLFLGRFLNEEMSSIPDIDIDVSTRHREKLIQYVYDKYGREHTAMVCTYVTFQARNAIREMGKAMGLPAYLIERMARSVSVYGAKDIEQDLAAVEEFRPYFAAQNSTLPVWQEFVALCREIYDFPRHLSIHNGGMLISACPLTDIVPLEKATMPGRIVCQWDKDSVADAGLIKVDLLGLRMLSLIHEACALVEEKKHDTSGLDLDRLPPDDEKVYDMICRGDTVGVFQVESRAQMQTLPQIKPRSIDDLTIEVALIRPGPLQGNMVHPYIKRRKGLEKVTYLHPGLKPILEDTLGVLLFQEQVIQVAVAIAGFTPGEADCLRRAMSRKRSKEAMNEMRHKFVDGARRYGLETTLAERIFAALQGFAEYGFCKSHAAGFALLCYRSAWLKKYHPAEFCCALLNNQPMGFYAPEVIVRDAKRHGVDVLPVDINRSDIRCTIEEGKVRLGLMYVKELGEKAMSQVIAERERGPYLSLADFYLRNRLERKPVENLILAGAFDSLPPGGAGPACRSRPVVGQADGCQKRQLLWQLGLLEKQGPGELPLQFSHTGVSLPAFTELEEMKADYEVQGLSTKYHPLQVLRKGISGDGLLKSSEIARSRPDTPVRVAGYVITRQRPVTAKGFAFITLEDEEGMVNVVIRPDVYRNYRQVFKLEPLIVVEGIIQRRDNILNIIARKLTPLRHEEQRQPVLSEPATACPK
ncbi:MAG: error-prone DNA polymerase [Dehalococcoidia bacterium]|nr:error-prone DNA polymerase [Dehalococcoidia bacterium]